MAKNFGGERRNLRQAVLAAFLMAMALAGTAFAGSLEDKIAALEEEIAATARGDYATVLRLVRPLADKGDAGAQSRLGIMYAQGLGVPQDYAEAVKWYRKAADQGYAAAQANLGVMYYKGQGVPQDYAEAMKWYRWAADQGYAKAQHNLGGMYAMGRGDPQDYAEAVKWYRKAADQGNAHSQNNLGVMYAKGQGVPQDYVQAHKWYNLAASHDPAAETEIRNMAIKNRDGTAREMTPQQIAEAQKLAREWKPTK